MMCEWRFALLPILLVAATACTSCPRESPPAAPKEPAATNRPGLSHYARRIVAAFEHTNLDRLFQQLPEALHPPREQEAYECIVLSHDPSTCDAFAYSVLIDPATGRFWLWRSGGIAGITEFRGPAHLDRNGTIRLPPRGRERFS